MKIIKNIKSMINVMLIRKKKFKFENVADEWLEQKKITVKNSTYYNYKFIVERHLKPNLKNIDIQKLNNFNSFTQKLSSKYAPKTVRDIANVLRAILSYYESEYGKKLNYKKINVPKIEKSRLKILTTKEKNKLEKYCLKENSLKTLGIIICLNTGMRIGELCALKWENIDLLEKNIYVKHTMQRIYNAETRKTVISIDTPKTECSIRTIPINKKTYEILNSIRKEYSKDAFFLTGDTNKYIEPRNYQNTFKQILKASKVKPYKFHILRHTFASSCVEVGMDIKTLSEILGHSNAQITLNIYVHSSRKIMKKYLEKL